MGHWTELFELACIRLPSFSRRLQNVSRLLIVDRVRFPWSTARRILAKLAFCLLLICSQFFELSYAQEGVAPADTDLYGISIEATHREHWAFQPILRVTPPISRDPSTSKLNSINPIDSFIDHQLAQAGLARSHAADRAAWLRRVTIDLIGLAPTAAELTEFLADDSPEARFRVVDRLLANPGYGIRWGRRWLDVVRFAETNGYERDGDKPYAWRYRDWVIQSLNRDLSFNRFLTEQIAGDLVPDRSADSMIATTFLRLGTWDDEPADPLVDRYDQLDDVVGTVSAAFLGMTLRCARCHNHKFEPLSQIDYASFLAFFDTLKRPQNGRTELDVDVGSDREVQLFHAARTRVELATDAVQRPLTELKQSIQQRYFTAGPKRLPVDAFEAHKVSQDKRTPEQKRLAETTAREFLDEWLEHTSEDERRQITQFESALKTLAQARPTPLPKAYIWLEAETAPITQVFRRGNPTTPGGRVSPDFPQVLAHLTISADPTAIRSSSQDVVSQGRSVPRRLALAQWMTSPQNPLVARVIANRLWQGHFGDGLVATENDFGVMGTPPTHPELLDWLATTLIENEWSLKSLHRIVVLSETYAQASVSHEQGFARDVDNRLLWRFPYRRVEAEVLRDTVLQASGELNRQLYGPGVYPQIHQGILDGQSRPGSGWGKSSRGDSSRRSVYVFLKRSLLLPELELLDLGDTTSSCEQRVVSTIPTQALTLLNGAFFNTQAEYFAERLQRDASVELMGKERNCQLIERGFQFALGRLPDHEELNEAVDFLERHRSLLPTELLAQRSALEIEKTVLSTWCLVLLNLNEFAYID